MQAHAMFNTYQAVDVANARIEERLADVAAERLAAGARRGRKQRRISAFREWLQRALESADTALPVRRVDEYPYRG